MLLTEHNKSVPGLWENTMVADPSIVAVHWAWVLTESFLWVQFSWSYYVSVSIILALKALFVVKAKHIHSLEACAFLFH